MLISRNMMKRVGFAEGVDAWLIVSVDSCVAVDNR